MDVGCHAAAIFSGSPSTACEHRSSESQVSLATPETAHKQESRASDILGEQWRLLAVAFLKDIKVKLVSEIGFI